MNNRYGKRVVLILLSLILSTSFLFSGTTGKIVGQVVDASSGEPLPGVNVVIENTTLGASTDVDGTYLILNVPPGTYSLRAIMIGYREMLVNEVRINADKTTRIDFQLKESTVELGETIEVTAERPLVKKDLTSTESVVSSEEIENLPVQDFTDVLNLQAGIVVDPGGGAHLRGGRSGEISYMVDGFSVNDTYSGTFAVEVENNSIQELNVISGTFNAEYGQAMSGVVNIVTKEGGRNYQGDASVYVGDYLSSNDDIFWNIGETNPIIDVRGNLSGPVPGINRLRFFASGRFFEDEGFIYGKDVFVPTDQSDFLPEDPEDRTIMSHGKTYQFSRETAQRLIEEADPVPMADTRRYTGNVKITYRPTDTDKINLEGIYQLKDWQEYTHRFRLNPTGDYQREQWSLTGMLFWNHVFSPRTFLDVRTSYFYTKYDQHVYEDVFDERYVPAERLQNSTGSAFVSAGQQMWHFNRSTTTHMVRADLTSQVTKQHQFKAGSEFKRHRLWMHEFEVIPEIPERIAPLSAFNNNRYLNHPVEAAVYIQDKMEFPDMVVNAGIRYDYFDPDGQVPTNFKNPSPENTRDAETSSQVSPRVGIAYSISETGKMHVSYGHFFQTPNFFYLYVNPEFDIFPLQSTPSPPPESQLNTVGNAELEPQKTVIYEIGIQQQLGAEFGISATAFYKDIRNLLGTEVLETVQGRKYGRYINRDYAFARGITLEFEKRHSSGVSANIDYTYQIAKGNASDPNTAFLDAQTDPPKETEKQFVPLDWDRRHQINATLTLGNIGNYALSFITKYGTGLPYTPTFQNVQTSIENSARKPSDFTVDVYLYKNISWAGLKYQFFVRAFNVFDRLNEQNVFTETGRAGYSLAPTYEGPPRGINTLEQFYVRPDFYSQPREIQIGLELKF